MEITDEKTGKEIEIIDGKTFSSKQQKACYEKFGGKMILKRPHEVKLPQWIERALQAAGYSEWTRIGWTTYKSSTWAIK